MIYDAIEKNSAALHIRKKKHSVKTFNSCPDWTNEKNRAGM